MTRLTIYPKGFFEVQLIFARKVAELIGCPFAHAVLLLPKAPIALLYQFYDIEK